MRRPDFEVEGFEVVQALREVHAIEGADGFKRYEYFFGNEEVTRRLPTQKPFVKDWHLRFPRERYFLFIHLYGQ